MMDDLDARLARYGIGAAPPADDVGEVEAMLARYDTLSKASTAAGTPEGAPSAPKLLAPPSTSTDYATTTATTPAEAKKEQKAETRRQIESGDMQDAAKAFGYGAARGLTLNAVDRLAGIGTDLGETLGSMASGTPADPNAAAKGRAEYLADEARASQGHTAANFVGNVVGAIPTTIATGGAGRVAPAALGPQMGGQAALRTLANASASPAGRMAASNFAAGAMAEPSDDIKEQAKSGLYGTAAGAAAGKVAEATIGKVIHGSIAQEARGLMNAIMRNEETGVAASATARRRFIERAQAAVQEVRGDKVLERTIREGDARASANIARSRLQVISAPREGMYAELDSREVLGIDQIDAAFRRAERVHTGAEKNALEAFRREIETDWLPKWQEQGQLVARPGRPLGVSGLGVREMLTKVQQGASRVIGGLEEGARKPVKDLLEDVASDIWQGHLDRMAKQAPDLVRNIRAYDRRASGLMAIETLMNKRALVDEEQRMGIGQRVRQAAGPIGLGAAAATAATGHLWPALAGVGTVAAAKRAPAAGRYLNDHVLVPLEQAALRGVPMAAAIERAAEQGIPQAIVRGIYSKVLSKDAGETKR